MPHHMPLRMTRADYDAAYADMSRWPWLDPYDTRTMPGYRLWYLNGPEEECCPCCDRKVVLTGWETLLLKGVLRALTAPVLGNGWAQAPQRVTCIDARGHIALRGWARVYRLHDGLIDLWVSRHRGDCRQGRWWPLGRVLWEMKEEAEQLCVTRNRCTNPA